jgi:hypothetical protein
MDESKQFMDSHLLLSSPVLEGAERKESLGDPRVGELRASEKQESEDSDACGCKAAGIGGLVGLLIYTTVLVAATWRLSWLAMICMGLLAFLSGVLVGKLVGLQRAWARGLKRSTKLRHSRDSEPI